MEDSLEKKVILKSGVEKKFLDEKRGVNNEILLGKGKFGAVFFALSIFGDEKVDVGPLICAKESESIDNSKCSDKKKNKDKNKKFSDVSDSILEDFLAQRINYSIYSPKILDMAVITNPRSPASHQRSYCSMEVIPQKTETKFSPRGKIKFGGSESLWFGSF